MRYIEGNYSRIDYFSFKIIYDIFDISFNSYKAELFRLLHVNENEFDRFNDFQYTDCRKYKANITIRGCPTESASRADNRNYYIIDLSGDSCEYIRESGTNMVDIIKFIEVVNNLIYVKEDTTYRIINYDDCSNLNNLICFINSEVSRFDVAVDLVNNKFFTLAELKEKIIGKFYQSRFRARLDNVNKMNCQVNETYLQGWANDEVDFHIKNTKKGFSAIWGSKTGLQLNIYDKLAEVYAKTKEYLPTDEIIRFELRFGTNKANFNYKNMYSYLVNDELDIYVGRVLLSVIRFIDCSKKTLEKLLQQNSVKRAPTWKPYKDFINLLCSNRKDIIKLGSKIIYPDKNDLNKNLDWLNASVYNALTKVSCLTSDDELLKIVCREAILKSFQKGRINNEFNVCLNQFGCDYSIPQMTLFQRWCIARDKYCALGGAFDDFKMPYSIWEKKFKDQINFDCGFISKQEEY